MSDDNCSLIVVMGTSNQFRSLRQPVVIPWPFARGPRHDGTSVFVIRPRSFQKPILLRH
jgi:hypothetical protein